MKKCIALFLLAAMAVLLCACGSTDSGLVYDKDADLNGDGKLTCSLTIRCDAALAHKDMLSEDTLSLLPADGIILQLDSVEFSAGDSVFDVLKREIVSRKLHFEYQDGTVYGSAYVEGIGNLYEFDCGPLSGWEFRLNDGFPGVGAGSKQVTDGDSILWAYTTDLGADIGNDYVSE